MTYNLDKFDRVLVVETEDLVEAKSVGIANNITDPRLRMRTDLTYTDYIDPITTVGPGANMSFGQLVRSYLPQTNGWSSSVTDFGDAITISVSYNNIKTAKSASQSFIILFTKKSGECRVKSNFTKWRTCNNPSQAASYIRGKVSSLPSKTSSMS